MNTNPQPQFVWTENQIKENGGGSVLDKSCIVMVLVLVQSHCYC